ncbi:MAG: 3-aminobutyryl-CoA ammonia lyase [Actinobacteria bacterium]|nr:3-aminobutyryl-CoA ammonia lyase [Actinomycetota bacterium]
MTEGWEVVHRRRLSAADAHYGGGLIDGAHALMLFGDVATELLVRRDGDEGLFRAYEEIEFLAPVVAGDFVEVRGRIDREGRTSRHMVFECVVYARAEPEVSGSAASILDDPLVAVRAAGTCVTPADRQRA